jgi:hypothetical protein
MAYEAIEGTAGVIERVYLVHLFVRRELPAGVSLAVGANLIRARARRVLIAVASRLCPACLRRYQSLRLRKASGVSRAAMSSRLAANGVLLRCVELSEEDAAARVRSMRSACRSLRYHRNVCKRARRGAVSSLRFSAMTR